ncbi:MAG: hypothetical protein H7176_07310, partial [Bdellovibrionales bacterium]|nr:hypothetical protein [Massilia sp.]
MFARLLLSLLVSSGCILCPAPALADAPAPAPEVAVKRIDAEGAQVFEVTASGEVKAAPA